MSTRKRMLAGVGVLLAVAVAAGVVFVVRQGRASARPNVILIVVDSLRADHVSCYGYERKTTPNIDALAGDGMVFRNAISAAPWTTPSVGCLMTSQYPRVLGIRDEPVQFRSGFPMLAEILKENGYATQGIVSHSLMAGSIGFGRGFEGYDEESTFGLDGISSPSVTAKAISYLRKPRSGPFFLFLHYFDPHYNFVLHKDYNFSEPYKGPVKSGEFIKDLWDRLDKLSAEDVRYLVSLYDSEIAFTDAYIGKVLEEIRRQGLYDKSLIIVTADHGEEFMERGWIGHTISVHQELIHVPLIVKPPGGRPTVVESFVGLIDLMPTIVECVGLKVPEGLEGQALDLSGEEPAGRPIFSETLNPQIQRANPPVALSIRSVIQDGVKLIHDEIKRSRQVYDLKADPVERKDLSGQISVQIERLKTLLSEWARTIGAKEQEGAGKDGRPLFTPDQIRQLKSVGYL